MSCLHTGERDYLDSRDKRCVVISHTDPSSGENNTSTKSHYEPRECRRKKPRLSHTLPQQVPSRHTYWEYHHRVKDAPAVRPTECPLVIICCDVTTWIQLQAPRGGLCTQDCPLAHFKSHLHIPACLVCALCFLPPGYKSVFPPSPPSSGSISLLARLTELRECVYWCITNDSK